MRTLESVMPLPEPETIADDEQAQEEQTSKS
jgi:hypothetical protein